MAADIIRFEDHSGGSVKTETVYNPDVNIISAYSTDLDLIVSIYIAHRTLPIAMFFKSRSLLDSFLTALDDALGTGGSGEVVLSNVGPIATTTTTTSAPTTTTTTLPE